MFDNLKGNVGASRSSGAPLVRWFANKVFRCSTCSRFVNKVGRAAVTGQWNWFQPSLGSSKAMKIKCQTSPFLRGQPSAPN